MVNFMRAVESLRLTNISSAYNTVLLKWRPCLGLLISATVSAAGPSSPPTLLLTARTWTVPGVRAWALWLSGENWAFSLFLQSGSPARLALLLGLSLATGSRGVPCLCSHCSRSGEDSDPWGFDSEVHDT